MINGLPANSNPWLLLNRYGLPSYNDVSSDHFIASPSRTRPQSDLEPLLPVLPIARDQRPKSSRQFRTREQLLSEMQRVSNLLQIRHMDRPFANALLEAEDTARLQHRGLQAYSQRE